MTDLDQYLFIAALQRRLSDTTFKHFGMEWNDFQDLEQKVIDKIPPKGIRAHGYTFTVETRVNHLDKILEERADVQIVERRGAGVSKRISLHK